MRKIALALLAFLLIFPLASANPKKNITAVGNITGIFSVYYTQTQINSSIESGQETFFKEKIGLRNGTSCTGYFKIVDLNYTIQEENIRTTLSEIELLDDSESLLQQANNTFTDADGNITVRFNSSEVALVKCNTTYTVFYIRYKLKPLDDFRSVVKTRTGNIVGENVSYTSPTVVATLENVTLVYKPTEWNKLESIKEVRYDNTVVTNYTFDDVRGILYDPDFSAGSTHYLYIEYSERETGHGTSPGGVIPISRPTTGITFNQLLPVLIMTFFVIILGIVAIVLMHK